MNRATRMLSSIRLYSNHLIRTPQVTNFTSFISSSRTHQNHFFSSKPQPFVNLILSSDNWSQELEQNLNETNPQLSHENVTYVLKKLDKNPKRASGFLNWAVSSKGFEPSSLIYSLMLRIYADKVTLKEFWSVIKEMKEKGCYIDEETYLTILGYFRSKNMKAEVSALKHFYTRMVKENAMDEVAKEVVEMADREDWGVVVEGRLRELKFEVSENFVLRVMKEMRGKGCSLKALSFFRWVGEKLGFEHNGVTYNGLLRVICQEDSIGEFWEVFREMKSVGYEMDLDTYIKISRHFQKCKMLKEAVELYEHMMDGPYKPSIYECNRLLPQIAGISSPDMDLVSRVVNKYEAAGYSLSKSIYDGIHRCLTTVGKFDEAKKIIETMKNAGFEPDNITYSQLIFGLCKSGRLEEASKVLDIMEEQGCIPDLKTWTILIQGHCKAKEVDRALLLFAKMIEKNIDADGDLLDVLLNGFLIQGRVLGAYQLLTEMVNRAHIKPWQATYKNLIQKLLSERKLEESLNLLRQMKKLNYPPFVEPFDEYISKFGTTEDAKEFLDALSVKDYPSISAYQRIFESFFSEGRHSDAKNLLYKCPHHVRKHKAISSLFGSAEGQPLPKSKVVVDQIST